MSAHVAAAPFRAHLVHVCESSGLEWPLVALAGELPLGLASALLDQRPGRRVQRIGASLAQAIWRLDADELRSLRQRPVSARSSARALRRLVAQGWTLPRLAGLLHTSQHELEAIMVGSTSLCAAVTDLRLTALLALGRPASAAYHHAA